MPLRDAQAIRRCSLVSRCEFGPDVPIPEATKFLLKILPYEDFMAVKQTDIGYVKNPTYHYHLDLKDNRPIRSKLCRFRPDEEEWLGNHLDDLVAKGVITPILPHEDPKCVTPLLLVPG